MFTNVMAEALTTVEGDAKAAARKLGELHPRVIQGLVWGEEGRLRFVAEERARRIAAAEYTRALSNRLTAELNRAMVAAGCTCRVLFEPMTRRDSWGDVTGYAVYADSQEGADRVAAWLCKWEERDYARRGGTYGGSVYQAQHAYRVEELDARDQPAAAPFGAFAAMRYHSIGD